MLRSGLSSSRVFSPLHEESGDEDVSVLPRHTKVIITGNNRTKSEWVGLQGVVKNAVGHGGWHWLELESGDKVKLQRNALSVVETPTGNEEEDHEMDYLGSGSDVQEKASLQLSSNGQYDKKNFTNGDSNGQYDKKNLTNADSNGQYDKKKRPKVKHAKPCTPASTKSVKSASLNSLMGIQANEQAPRMKVNFSNLSTRSLLRYWRRFNLGNCSPNITKKQLVHAVQRHFTSQTVDEEKAIVEFIGSAKRLKSEGARA